LKLPPQINLLGLRCFCKILSAIYFFLKIRFGIDPSLKKFYLSFWWDNIRKTVKIGLEKSMIPCIRASFINERRSYGPFIKSDKTMVQDMLSSTRANIEVLDISYFLFIISKWLLFFTFDIFGGLKNGFRFFKLFF